MPQARDACCKQGKTGTAKQQNRLQQHVSFKLLAKGLAQVQDRAQDREQGRARVKEQAKVQGRGRVGMQAQVQVAKHRLLQVSVWTSLAATLVQQ